MLACSLSAFAQAKKTIFMITDAEGVAGICRQDQTDPKDPELRQLLTGEINAAVDGFFEGGADEVIVWDGHGGSATLSVTTIHPRAKLVIGSIGANYSFDRHYTALVFVGQHSMAGVRGGIMAHSYSSLGIQNMRLNGKPIGEIEAATALAGVYDIPVILLTGDQAAADEMHAIVPEAETAVVKEGLQRYACISLSAQSARDLIRATSRRAMGKIGQVRPYKVSGPVTIEIEHTTRNSLGVDAGRIPGAVQVDDRTIRYSGKDFLEAWMRYRVH
jgi:D-amino peptidase